MQILNIEWKWNIPNALSVFRIVLIPVFLVLYLTPTVADEWAFLALLLSGLTDMADGYIARRFNMITACGKLLDPLADKLTQVAVVVALTTRYPETFPLAILCFIKEACQAVGSVIMLKKKIPVRASKWFGKLSTIAFYVCMLALVLWQDVMPVGVKWAIIGVAGLSMLLAFFGYVKIFIQVHRPPRQQDASEDRVPEKG